MLKLENRFGGARKLLINCHFAISHYFILKYLINCHFAGASIEAEDTLSSPIRSDQQKTGKSCDRHKVCWFFKRGHCHFGARCQKAHVVGVNRTVSGEQDGTKQSRKSGQGTAYSLISAVHYYNFDFCLVIWSCCITGFVYVSLHPSALTQKKQNL